MSWYTQWFNEDYLKLYAYRNQEEAERYVDSLIHLLHLRGGERILDLGCGAGRHAIAFAKKGFDVTGVDLSEYLIAQAKQRANKDENLKVKFLTEDIFHLPEIGTFDLIVNLFTSFGYFREDEKNARIFHIARSHLNSGGKFFLDYLHPYQVIRDLVPYEERIVNGEKVRISREIENDRVIKTIQFPGRRYQEKVKLYTKEQIEQMFQKNHFSVVEVWNDYEGHPWKEKGDRQLFYCQAI